jgi:uncharacterized membrane protein
VRTIVIILMPAILASMGMVARAGDLDPVKDVRPFLDQYCMTCHDADTAKGGVTLPAALDDSALLSGAGMWRDVLDQLREQSMPPAGKKQPTPEERERVMGWLRQSLIRVQPNVRDPGPPRR